MQMPAVRPGSNQFPAIMRASFFRLVLRNKTGFSELRIFYWCDPRACAAARNNAQIAN